MRLFAPLPPCISEKSSPSFPEGRLSPGPPRLQFSVVALVWRSDDASHSYEISQILKLEFFFQPWIIYSEPSTSSLRGCFKAGKWWFHLSRFVNSLVEIKFQCMLFILEVFATDCNTNIRSFGVFSTFSYMKTIVSHKLCKHDPTTRYIYIMNFNHQFHHLYLFVNDELLILKTPAHFHI